MSKVWLDSLKLFLQLIQIQTGYLFSFKFGIMKLVLEKRLQYKRNLMYECHNFCWFHRTMSCSYLGFISKTMASISYNYSIRLPYSNCWKKRIFFLCRNKHNLIKKIQGIFGVECRKSILLSFEYLHVLLFAWAYIGSIWSSCFWIL